MPAQQGLTTDSGVLSTEAGSFMSISAELKTMMHKVEEIGGNLAGFWTGMAGSAAQEALQRFHEAAEAQRVVLDDVANNIQAGGVKYDGADQDGAATLAAASFPNLGLGGH